MPHSLNESQYSQIVEDTLIAIEDALEEIDEDIDYETSGSILTITLANGSKIIINKQTPVRQLWLAAKSGGYHLDWQQDHWQTDKEGESLTDLLSRVFHEQSGISHSFELNF